MLRKEGKDDGDDDAMFTTSLCALFSSSDDDDDDHHRHHRNAYMFTFSLRVAYFFHFIASFSPFIFSFIFWCLYCKRAYSFVDVEEKKIPEPFVCLCQSTGQIFYAGVVTV